MRIVQRIFALCLLCLGLWLPLLHAQTDDFSPYSIYGPGEIQGFTAPNAIGMGGVGVGLRDSMSINLTNPASVSSIELATFQIGAEMNLGRRTINGQEFRAGNLYPNEFALALPILRKNPRFQWTSAVAFRPFSQAGYDFNDSLPQVFGEDTLGIERSFIGSGGWNRLTLSNGFTLFGHLAVGVNLHYNFGSLSRNRSLLFPANSGFLSTRVTELVTAGNFDADFGVQYTGRLPYQRLVINAEGKTDTIRSKMEWTAGLTFRPAMDWTVNRSNIAYQFLNQVPGPTVDTLEQSPLSSGTVGMPMSLGAGFQLRKPAQYSINVDAQYTAWSDFRYFNENLPFYSNSYQVALGTQIHPGNLGLKQGRKLFSRMLVVRAGLRYLSRKFQPEFLPVDEFGMAFGLGLPFNHGIKSGRNMGTSKYVGSYFNLGFDVSWGNSRAPGTYSDMFFRITLGLSLRDWWFDKPRIN